MYLASKGAEAMEAKEAAAEEGAVEADAMADAVDAETAAGGVAEAVAAVKANASTMKSKTGTAHLASMASSAMNRSQS